MPNLGTATVTPKTSGARPGVGGRNERWIHVKIVTGDGSSTYPSGGVPLPPKLGIFARSLNDLIIYDANSDGIDYNWDSVNNKLRMFWSTQQTGGAGNRAGIEFVANTDVPALNVTLYARAHGS